MHRALPCTDMFPIGVLCQHRNVLNPWQLHYQSCFSFEQFLKSCMTLRVKEPALPQDEDATPVNRMIWQRGWSAWDASADTGMLMWVHSSSHPSAATGIIPRVCGADVAFTGPDSTESECWGCGCCFISFRGNARGKRAEGSGTSLRLVWRQ